MNLPWSNWTSRDVFPTPLSPTKIVCKDQVKRHQHREQAVLELAVVVCRQRQPWLAQLWWKTSLGGLWQCWIGSKMV